MLWGGRGNHNAAAEQEEAVDLQQIKDNVCVENVVDEQKDKGLDLDEEMLMTGLAMFENDF